MKEYEVVLVQESSGKARVVRKEFDCWEAARSYAHEICLEDNRVVSCSIHKGENRCLVMDVL